MKYYKQLEKAFELYKRIRQFDAEIIQIEKMAQMIAAGTLGITLQMKVEKEPVEEVQKDLQEGILLSPLSGLLSMMHGTGYSPDYKKPKENHEIFEDWIGEANALRLLEFFLKDKMMKRDTLIEAVNRITQELT